MERTVVMLKPDCITRGLSGEILSRFEKKGLKIVGMKMMKLKHSTLDVFYSHHKGKPFFERLIKFMRKTPVIVIVLEGINAVEVVRRLLGVTVGREAAAGTVRGDYSMSTQSNLVHASDSVERAKFEIELLFKPREIFEYKNALDQIIYAEEELQLTKPVTPKPRKIPGKED